jgi:hypothetical protein
MTSLIPNTRRPDISFHPDGRIDITARIAKLLQLEDGDVIDVAKSFDEYLLYVQLRADKCEGRHEATVHPTNKGKRSSNNFRAHSRRLCQSMRVASGGSPADEPLRLPAGALVRFGRYGFAIPLITRNPL